jgi:mono/diheme cytochrome c family protein
MGWPKGSQSAAFRASVALSAILLAAGCAKNDGSANATAPADPALIAAGKSVFASNGCANCHAVAGQGGSKAPDLTHVGAEHAPQWLVEHVKDPKVHNPSSRMPAFQGKISDRDLLALGAYLSSLM